MSEDLKWGGPIHVKLASGSFSKAMAFGHIEGTPEDPSVTRRVAPELNRHTMKCDMGADWVLGSLAARVTAALTTEPERAGLDWAVVIGGIRGPEAPCLTWTEYDTRMRDSDLKTSRVQAEIDARAAQAPARPPMTPAEQAAYDEKRRRLDAHMEAILAKEDAEREASAIHLTVEQYASLCAERATHPQAIEQVAQRYGFSSTAALEAEDEEWKVRFSADPSLQLRFHQVHAQWLAWLSQQGR